MKTIFAYTVALLLACASLTAMARLQVTTQANVYNMIVSIQTGSR